MASAAPPKPRKICVSGDATQSTSSDGSNTSAGNSSGAPTKKPKPKGKVVKSRYMMVPDKKPAAKNAVMNQSICVPNRPGTPTKLGTPTKPSTPSRRSEPPRLYKIPSKLQSNILDAMRIGKNELQSTLLEGHSILPELDISVINDKTVHKPSEPQDMDLEHAIDNQTWLLTCLTVLMERNTTRLKEEAERSLLAVMEEEENLRRKVQEQKRQLRLRQKEKELDSLLDLQIAALTPLAAAAEKFKQEYKTFATALDTTRHELPVKNIHIEGDRQAFLDKAAVCLKETEKLLSELNPAAAEESDRACELLKAVKDTTRSVDEELGRVFTEVLELSSLVSRETVLIHQRSAEESTGLAVARDLYFLKDY